MRGLVHAIIGKGTFVAPSANVSISTAEKALCPGLRIATCSPKNGEELRRGLELIQQFIKEQSLDTADFIV